MRHKKMSEKSTRLMVKIVSDIEKTFSKHLNGKDLDDAYMIGTSALATIFAGHLINIFGKDEENLKARLEEFTMNTLIICKNINCTYHENKEEPLH